MVFAIQYELAFVKVKKLHVAVFILTWSVFLLPDYLESGFNKRLSVCFLNKILGLIKDMFLLFSHYA
jgi:hypothetical protein